MQAYPQSLGPMVATEPWTLMLQAQMQGALCRAAWSQQNGSPVQQADSRLPQSGALLTPTPLFPRYCQPLVVKDTHQNEVMHMQLGENDQACSRNGRLLHVAGYLQCCCSATLMLGSLAVTRKRLELHMSFAGPVNLSSQHAEISKPNITS